MKAGNLVTYREFPHKELHESGITGLVVRGPHAPYFAISSPDGSWGICVEVVWSTDRGALYPAGTICSEYMSDLEIVDETVY